MSDPRHTLGLRAENAVATALEHAGWRILAHRWRSAGGELDLVCLDPAGVLVGVEVRARSSPRAGTAVESVDHHRVARLRATLAEYALRSGEARRGLRVDVVSVDRGASGWRAVRLAGIDRW